MRSRSSVPSVLVILIAGGLLVSPAQTEAAGAAPPVTSGRAGLPAGVTSGWWAEVQDSLQQARTRQNQPSSTERVLFFPDWTAQSNQREAEFGYSVSGAGDVNGDGYDDVIVGAYNYDNDQIGEGRAFAYHGSPSGLSTTANWTAESDQSYAGLGHSVAAAGDVNGDGYDDVIVGAFRYDNGSLDEGRAFAYHGSAAGLSTTANWTAESNQGFAEFGESVAGAGDVNGDGYDDVIVGASSYDNAQFEEGRAYAYYGSAAGLSITASWIAESDQSYAGLGNSVAAAGDVNGDGYDDVIVGAQGYDNGQTNGRVFAYHGSAAGLSTTASWFAESDQNGAAFGRSVAGARDVNGDGYDDVIVGAWLYDNGRTDEGRAFAYYGSAAGLSTTANWTAESNQIRAGFGLSVAGAGDVNGDGYDDVIVGAWHYHNGEDDEGAAFVFCGSAAGVGTVPCTRAESNQAESWFGNSVAAAGNVNGDGYDDVIVGARSYTLGQANEGVAVAKYGRPG